MSMVLLTTLIRSARLVLLVVTTHSEFVALSGCVVRTSYAVLLLSRGSISSHGALGLFVSFVPSGVLRGVDSLQVGGSLYLGGSFIGNGALVLPDSFCDRRFSHTP